MALGGASLFGSSAALIGNPQFGASNPFSPGASPLGQGGSFLGRLLAGNRASGGQFGLGDHVTVPVSQYEAQFAAGLTITIPGLYSRARTLREAAGPLISNLAGTIGEDTHGRLIGGKTGLLGAGTGEGVFSRRRVTVVSISPSDTPPSGHTAVAAKAKNDARLARYAIDVTQLATADLHTGTQLLSSAATTISNGSQVRITITSTGTTYDTAVVTIAGDTNSSALSKVATAINDANAGVTASVTTTGDVSKLVVTANSTGTDAAFTIADLAAGNITSVTGIGAATTAAQDAALRINGIERTEQSNQFNIDLPYDGASSSLGRVQLTLLSVTESTATVDVGVAFDADQMVHATRSLVAAVNDLREYVSDKPDILTAGLIRRLDVMVAELKSSLESIGVIADAASGALSVDETKLRKAVQERPYEVERTIGYANGLASRTLGVANTVLNDPSIAFVTLPVPIGREYGRWLAAASIAHHFLFSGLFVNLAL